LTIVNGYGYSYYIEKAGFAKSLKTVMNRIYSRILNNFNRAHVAVVGDTMLDRFWLGDVYRISPEAPVPILSITNEVDVAGGAGNVASNITALGAQTSLVSVIGTDRTGDILVDLCSQQRINTSTIARSAEYITPQKTRLVGRGQHILRIDREEVRAASPLIERELLEQFMSGAPYDAIVISDYAKGTVTPKLISSVIHFARQKNIPVVVDTKPENINLFKGVTVVTPNLDEAIRIAGTKDLEKAGFLIQKRTGASVLITQGGQGMTLFQGKKITHIPAREHSVFDVVGAGDTVVATLATALASGAQLVQAARIANHAAGIVVGKRGTATVSMGELTADLENA
jgi:rfaE bifunctional protein kinase chain/domain